MLEIRSLTRKFPGQSENALTSVSFSLSRGDCAVISGANGSGKSVLMHLIAGLDRPTSGEIRFSPESDGTLPRVGLVFQDADSQILGDTPLEDVECGPKNRGIRAAEARIIARAALTQTGLAARESVSAATLSGGEKRRLAVAGILAINAQLFIFDEPFANLDWPGVVQVNGIMEELKRQGKTLIILTHELEKVLALSNRFLVLFRGQLVFDGTPQDALMSAPLHEWGIRNPLRSYTRLEDLIWKEEGTIL